MISRPTVARSARRGPLSAALLAVGVALWALTVAVPAGAVPTGTTGTTGAAPTGTTGAAPTGTTGAVPTGTTGTVLAGTTVSSTAGTAVEAFPADPVPPPSTAGTTTSPDPPTPTGPLPADGGGPTPPLPATPGTAVPATATTGPSDPAGPTDVRGPTGPADPTGTPGGGATPSSAASDAPAAPVRLAPEELRIVNYYPADAPWTSMWTSYSAARTDADFAAIASLNATTVRIIVQPAGVGWPTVTPAGAAALRDTVDIAAAHGLTVELTLFDLWYSWSELAASKAWVAQLLSPYRDDPRIVLVELENEMTFGHPPAVAWAQEMLPYLAIVLPGVPRSMSTNTVTALRALDAAIPRSSLDVIDIHLYGDLSTMPAYVAAARAVAAGRPVIVGEAGRSTGDGGTAGSEQGQLAHYAAVAQLTRDAGIGVFAPWTLTDFALDTMPAAFRTPSEASFGLRRLDGSWKPAADLVRRMFGPTGVPAVDPARPAATALDADGGFERADPTPSSAGRLGSWRVFDAAQIGGVGAVAGAGVSGAAMMLTRTGGSPSMVPAVCQTFLLLSGARTVTAGVSIRLEAATGFSRIAVAWFDGATYLGSSESVNARNDRSGWQRITVTGRAPAAATSFQIHLKSAYNSGTAWFDDVQLG
ncbi:cellulase family glycosylhydrolase [Nakamurella deserti]|uniref:cellulase family glycosylhydrolase n=1 Tax=Nakamurella deserti TaxID=2164074 RepID=UPI000DBE313F|nr:cellulase family glycosylhydrolase [Nakamurella deserti]